MYAHIFNPTAVHHAAESANYYALRQLCNAGAPLHTVNADVSS